MPHFNRQAAVAYARRWAQSANPQYPPFGEDCTNFVSLVLDTTKLHLPLLQ